MRKQTKSQKQTNKQTNKNQNPLEKSDQLSRQISIAGSFFIVGPKRHLEAFKDETLRIPHLVATCVLAGCIVMVFISALAIKSTALSIIFVIFELIALVFFTITLKKILWTGVKTFFTKCFKCGGGN